MQTVPPVSLLVLGEFDTGKTHYGAQLLLRLNQHSSGLRMRGAAVNIEPFETAIERMNEGRAAPHTAMASYMESHWPIEDKNERAIDLVWPDYGGEQISTIIASRRISPAWRARIIRSGGWLFFVRLQQLNLQDDIFSRPLASILNPPPSEKDFKLSDPSRLIELLQMLLFVRGVGTVTQLSSPALVVLLSCWDEIAGVQPGSRPEEVLGRYLPLLADFVATNWAPARVSVLGLSSLEKTLDEKSQDEDFRSRGPEQFGYIVRADGTRDCDLTIPISQLAAQVG